MNPSERSSAGVFYNREVAKEKRLRKDFLGYPLRNLAIFASRLRAGCWAG